MASNQENIQLIVDIEKEIINNNEISKQDCKEQIILLETAKEKFQEPAAILDRALYKQVSELDDKRQELSDAYLARTTASNPCKSDLFWRYVGFTSFPGTPSNYQYTLRCEKLSKYFDTVEDNPDDSDIDSISVTRANSFDVGTKTLDRTRYSLQTVDDKLKLSNSFDGIAELEDRDGLKLYSEPYTVDLLDTLVAESYGTIGFQTNFLTLLTPVEGDVTNISIDNIVSIEPNPFAPELSATVVGIGTTSVDFSGFSSSITGGITTSDPFTVPYIEINTLSNIDLTPDTTIPESERIYPFFQFSISPDEVESKEFAVDFEESPYTPQKIKVLEFDSLEQANKNINGNGIKIEKTNEGFDTRSAKWDAQLEGFPNPKNLDATIEEPEVSAGQHLYIIGFDEKPLKQNGNDASEGDEYVIDTRFSSTYPDDGLYGSLSSCSGLDNAVTDAKQAKDDAFNAWDTSDVVNSRIEFSNLLKEEINDINLRIWSLRIQLGDTKSTIKKKSDFNELVVSSDLLGLLNDAETEL